MNDNVRKSLEERDAAVKRAIEEKIRHEISATSIEQVSEKTRTRIGERLVLDIEDVLRRVWRGVFKQNPPDII